MASFFSIRVALFLITTTCFAQQANQLVYIEGTVQRADGTPVTGASVSFSTGTTFLTSGLGHYFAVVPSDFTGSAAASGNGYSYGTRFYSATVSDQLKQDFTGGTYTASGIVQARFGGVPGVVRTRIRQYRRYRDWRGRRELDCGTGEHLRPGSR